MYTYLTYSFSKLQIDNMNIAFLNIKRIRFKYFFTLTHAIPSVTLLICFTITLTWNHTNAVKTHCRNFNYLPSISVVTGDFYPQKYISLTLLTIYIGPRLFLSYWYYFKCFLHRNVTKKKDYRLLNYAAFYLNVLEITFSFLTIAITTHLSNSLHIFSFSQVVLYSTLNIIITTILCQMRNTITLKSKQRCMIVYLLSITFLLYFNHRHLYYCDVLAFTYFSYYEYILLFSNHYYHFLAYYEINMDSILMKKKANTI
jgi:hypothetical protein